MHRVTQLAIAEVSASGRARGRARAVTYCTPTSFASHSHRVRTTPIAIATTFPFPRFCSSFSHTHISPSTPAVMKAIRCTDKGGPEVMVFEEKTALPQPMGKQVQVQVAYAGVNFIDTYQRTGLYPLPAPGILGKEGAGVISALGPDASRFKIGDRVVFINAQGSYADYVCIDQDSVCLVPDSVSYELAAASFLQGLTAHYLVTSTFPVKQGDRVLVHAGAGGTGALVIQMAKLKGAIVYTTVSTEDKAKLARESGADHVILYTQSDFREEIMKLTQNKGVDVVYDSVGATTYLSSMKSLRPLGYLVCFGNSSGPVPDINPLQLMSLGSLFLTRPTLKDYVLTYDALVARANDLFTWIAQGKVNIRIAREFPLSEGAASHEFLQSRQATGKILIAVNKSLK